MTAGAERKIAGNGMIDLIKFLKNYERSKGLLPLRADARALVSSRVMASAWYPLATFHELLRAIDRIAIHGDEGRAIEIGAQGGASMRGLQKAYIVPGDPQISVLAMRHAWRAHYDFGVLSAEAVGTDAVQFVLSGYPDIPMSHALMMAGWGVAAARAAGLTSVMVEVGERPWQGSNNYTYKVCLSGGGRSAPRRRSR